MSWSTMSPSAAVRGSLWSFLLFSGVTWLAISWSVLQIEPADLARVAGPVILFGAATEGLRALSPASLWWAHAGLAALFATTGVLLLADSGDTLATPAALIGWYLLVRGAADITMSIIGRDVEATWGLRTVLGAVQVGLGFYASSSFLRTDEVAIMVLGALATVRAVADLVTAMTLRDAPAAELERENVVGVAGYAAGLADYAAAATARSGRPRHRAPGMLAGKSANGASSRSAASGSAADVVPDAGESKANLDAMLSLAGASVSAVAGGRPTTGEVAASSGQVAASSGSLEPGGLAGGRELATVGAGPAALAGSDTVTMRIPAATAAAARSVSSADPLEGGGRSLTGDAAGAAYPIDAGGAAGARGDTTGLPPTPGDAVAAAGTTHSGVAPTADGGRRARRATGAGDAGPAGARLIGADRDSTASSGTVADGTGSNGSGPHRAGQAALALPGADPGSTGPINTGPINTGPINTGPISTGPISMDTRNTGTGNTTGGTNTGGTNADDPGTGGRRAGSASEHGPETDNPAPVDAEAGDPVSGDPVSSDPASSDPASSDPASSDPAPMNAGALEASNNRSDSDGAGGRATNPDRADSHGAGSSDAASKDRPSSDTASKGGPPNDAASKDGHAEGAGAAPSTSDVDGAEGEPARRSGSTMTRLKPFWRKPAGRRRSS